MSKYFFLIFLLGCSSPYSQDSVYEITMKDGRVIIAKNCIDKAEGFWCTTDGFVRVYFNDEYKSVRFVK